MRFAQRSVGWAAISFATLAAAAVSAAAEPDRSPPPYWPYETQVGDFAVHANYDVTPRRALLEQLADLNHQLAHTLQIQVQQETVHLILFGSHGPYRQYLQLHFPEIPSRQALYVRRRGAGMVFAYENRGMDVDLRHEATHALLNASLPYVPLWLDEGLAEYFEVPAAERAAGHAHHPIVRLRALVGIVPNLESLEQLSDLGEMNGGHYRDAWAWVHFLLHESDQSRAVLSGFLQQLQAHSPPGALSRRMAAEMPDHRDRFRKHFR